MRKKDLVRQFIRNAFTFIRGMFTIDYGKLNPN